MELVSLSLHNYRRFNKDTTIHFAQGEQNVTIIRAENGAGKTGILMALLFGLFGTVHYEQFQIQDDKDFMVSSYLLGNNEHASCTVAVEFMEENHKYKITRTISAQNINGRIQQDNTNVETNLLEDGVDTKKKTEEINHFMNSLVGENIRGFLFFDGVKYTDLFKQNDKNTKLELQKIIEKMLNINDLDVTICALRSLAANVNNGKASGKTLTEIAAKKTEIKDLNEEKAKADEDWKINKEKADNLTIIYNDTVAKMNGLEQYHGLADKITTVNGKIGIREGALSQSFKGIQQTGKFYFLSTLYSSLGEESKPVFEKLSENTGGEANMVKMILKSGKCICCDEPLNDEKIAHLKLYLSEIEKAEKYPFGIVSKAGSNVHRIEEHESGASFSSNFDETIKNIGLVEGLKREKMKLESQIPQDQNVDNLIADITKTSSEKGSCTELIKQANDAMSADSVHIEDLDKRLDKANGDLEALNEEAAQQTGMVKQYNFYKDTEKRLSELKTKYLIDAQKEISLKANEYFLKLLSDDDRSLFKELRLDDDYSIKVYNNQDREIFGQMSAGQKLLASMAFVMGLTATASQAKPTCNFPLVMDTPFSNLDLKNRQSLIGLMPSVVKQWIITPIDTELTPSEIQFFAEGDRVGNVYWLRKNGTCTSLESCNSIMDL